MQKEKYVMTTQLALSIATLGILLMLIIAGKGLSIAGIIKLFRLVR